MLIPIKFEVNGVFDTETEEIRILNSKRVNRETCDIDDEVELILRRVYYRTGTIAIGAKTKVGGSLPKNSEIKVMYNGEEFKNGDKSIITHSTIQGRISGLTKLFNLHPELECGKIKVRYDCSINTVYIDYVG